MLNPTFFKNEKEEIEYLKENIIYFKLALTNEQNYVIRTRLMQFLFNYLSDFLNLELKKAVREIKICKIYYNNDKSIILRGFIQKLIEKIHYINYELRIQNLLSELKTTHGTKIEIIKKNLIKVELNIFCKVDNYTIIKSFIYYKCIGKMLLIEKNTNFFKI
jgi:hypothetical protein